jgi:hypothetical protein
LRELLPGDWIRMTFFYICVVLLSTASMRQTRSSHTFNRIYYNKRENGQASQKLCMFVWGIFSSYCIVTIEKWWWQVFRNWLHNSLSILAVCNCRDERRQGLRHLACRASETGLRLDSFPLFFFHFFVDTKTMIAWQEGAPPCVSSLPNWQNTERHCAASPTGCSCSRR